MSMSRVRAAKRRASGVPGGRVRPSAVSIACTCSSSARGGSVVSTATTQLRYQRVRSEEHTSELQSQSNLVCRLLLEKKKEEQLLSHHTHAVVQSAHDDDDHSIL